MRTCGEVRRVVGAGLAVALVLVAGCGGDDGGDGGGSGGGAGGRRAGEGLEAALGEPGAVLLAEPASGELVAVGPDGGGRRSVEGAPSMAAGGAGVFPLGVPGTAVTSDEEGRLFLVEAGEGRATDLGVAPAGGDTAVVGPNAAQGGGERFAVAASIQGGDPVLIDAEAGTATDLTELVGGDGVLFVNVVAPDERHLAVVAADGVHVIATEDATDLGTVGDRIGAFSPDGDTLYVTRNGRDGSGGSGGSHGSDGSGGSDEVVRVDVDDVGDPDAGEVVATGEGMAVIAAFADTVLVADGDEVVLAGGGDPEPVGLGGRFGGGALAGAEAALVRVDGGEAASSWALVDAAGEVEPLPELDDLEPVGGGRGTLVLADGRAADEIGALAVARVEDGTVEVAVAPVDVPAGAMVPNRFVPSPDGRQVAGTWFLDDETETFVVDVAGGGDLRTIPGGFGAWSPAGEDVVVGRVDAEARSVTAVVVAPDGTETDLGAGRPLAWTRG